MQNLVGSECQRWLCLASVVCPEVLWNRYLQGEVMGSCLICCLISRKPGRLRLSLLVLHAQPLACPFTLVLMAPGVRMDYLLCLCCGLSCVLAVLTALLVWWALLCKCCSGVAKTSMHYQPCFQHKSKTELHTTFFYGENYSSQNHHNLDVAYWVSLGLLLLCCGSGTLGRVCNASNYVYK